MRTALSAWMLPVDCVYCYQYNESDVVYVTFKKIFFLSVTPTAATALFQNTEIPDALVSQQDHILRSSAPHTTGDHEACSAMPADSSNDLFVRFINGDNNALVDLFDRHNHRLFLYCVHLVRDRGRAEDLTQELWERIINLRTEKRLTAENPLGLLLTIARNLCLDTLRRERPYTTLDELPEASHPVARIPELSHLEELVILALPHLPLDQREVLILNAYSGYRFDEIAEMLGEPHGAIRTRAWRARAHLGRIISAMVGIREDGERNGGSERREQ